ncbi:O-antigen ligase family protein [Caballeronia sp. dw_276]|uniref:O-antigen ligase family protein n=1 Tax=Caballeronia sp. dw_276 TaxID=2719795 RepID=UPI001BD26625|nr:O-antigen ligase family protein [Caballeronia sp. dw_276]
MTKMCMQVERVLWVACPVIMFVAMFAHMTALENMALGLVGIGTLAAAFSPERPSPLRWPLLWPIAAWAAWALISVSWSPFPRDSMHAWLDEVLYPLVSFLAFWLVGTRTERPQQIVLINWVACLLLAAGSLYYWGRLQPPTDPADVLLHYYNRVGHTSTLAIFSITLFTGLLMDRRWRLWGLSGIVLALVIGLATLNRFFWPAAGLTLVIAAYPLYRRHLLLAAVSVVVICVAAVGTLELSVRLRLGHNMPKPAAREVTVAGDKMYVPEVLAGIGDAMSSDTRPKLWAFYGREGEARTWTGVGFGKPLPGRVFQAEIPPSLLEREPQALTHAHNLFLNTWLETGIVGVVLEISLLLALIWRFWRLRHAVPWVSAAGIALVMGMVAKNSTDDFMWQTTALAFWCFSGFLMGQGEKMAGMIPGAREDAKG